MRHRRRPRGLTLIEIVVVITISAMLMSAVAVSALQIYDHSQTEKAKLDVKNLGTALDAYRLQKGRYPAPAEGLAALTKSKVLKELPDDPWGTPYAYALEDGEPVVTSYGADGVPGGSGRDADITSRAASTD